MRLCVRIGVVMALALAPQLAFAQPASDDFDTVWSIVHKRCAICHSAIPQEDGLNAGSQPPKGVKFDDHADLVKFAPQVLATMTSRSMPPDNATHMTDEERQIVGRWIQAGAKVP